MEHIEVLKMPADTGIINSPGKRSGMSTTPIISAKIRWASLIIIFIFSATILRFPFAVQNFMRADGLLALGLNQRAINQYKRAIFLDPHFDQAYWMLAWAYELNHEGEKTRETFEKGLKNPHDDEMIFLHYIVYLWRLSDNRRALEVAMEAYSQFPESRNVLRVYGDSLEKNGSKEEARIVWLHYLKLFPDDEAVRSRIN